jgi:NAD(P)-dependent dehydrogenase (short-subunit alcohol dehydrogenase family)
MSLAGKVALVTGATRGIGRAIVDALTEAGAKVVACGVQEEGVRRLSAELGDKGRAVVADVGTRAGAERLVQEATSVFGRVDLLVNNAGIAPRLELEQMADQDFDRVLAVNLAGPFYLARRVVPGMKARGFGRIVNVSSISATLGTPRMTGYCASKWGLNGLTQALAEELKPSGIFVAAVLPGSVDTDMLQGSGFAPAMAPADVARIVRYLCDEAPFAMTGSLVEAFG